MLKQIVSQKLNGHKAHKITQPGLFHNPLVQTLCNQNMISHEKITEGEVLLETIRFLLSRNAIPVQVSSPNLIPKSYHTNKWFKKRFDKDDMRGRSIDICRKCHSFLHKKFSEKQLGRELNTLEKILENDLVKTYVDWGRKNNP